MVNVQCLVIIGATCQLIQEEYPGQRLIVATTNVKHFEEFSEARYIYGQVGKGGWAFYGGHDPEDYQHRVGDPKTELELHPNSPGYRLILNNVLFPAARKKKQKT